MAAKNSPEANKRRNQKWRESHREEERERGKEYRELHPEKVRESYRKWASVKLNAYCHKRRTMNLNFKLARNLRTRLYTAVKRNSKVGSAVRDLGLSIEHFKAWIEGQFEEGMSWENWGKWHLDHVRPLAAFDLTDRDQLLQACNWYNYQPLWAEDNLRKGCN